GFDIVVLKHLRQVFGVLYVHSKRDGLPTLPVLQPTFYDKLITLGYVNSVRQLIRREIASRCLHAVEARISRYPDTRHVHEPAIFNRLPQRIAVDDFAIYLGECPTVAAL